MRKGKPGNIVQQAKNEKGQFFDWHNGSKGGGRGTMGKFPAKTMTDKTLSRQAQAVMDAAFPAYDDEHLYAATCERHAGMIAVAALRAAADQMSCYQSKKFLYSIADAMKLLAIADELENVK